MKFPNLDWALRYQRLQPARCAEIIGMGAVRFNACLEGRAEFAAGEREGIARALGFSAAWLFSERNGRCGSSDRDVTGASAPSGR